MRDGEKNRSDETLIMPKRKKKIRKAFVCGPSICRSQWDLLLLVRGMMTMMIGPLLQLTPAMIT